MSTILTLILAENLIAIICNDILCFLFCLVCFLACTLSVSNSIGLIDLAYRDPLHCLWTIRNLDITNAVAVFIIQRIIISSCRYLELAELFSLGLLFSIMGENLRVRNDHNLCTQAIFNVLFVLFFPLKTNSRSRYAS